MRVSSEMMGGRGGGGADTELKTKTPHVNVGKKMGIRSDLQADHDVKICGFALEKEEAHFDVCLAHKVPNIN